MCHAVIKRKVLDNSRPRKLTEIKYERLQGLPDDFTKVQLMVVIYPIQKGVV